MNVHEKVKWLTDYLKLKNKLLRKESGTQLDLTTKEDTLEIAVNWSEDQINQVYNDLQKTLNHGIVGDDFIFCPWCINQLGADFFDCTKCGYGKRHGLCSNPLSTYKKITRNLLPHKIYQIMFEHRQEFLSLGQNPDKPTPKFHDAAVDDCVWTEEYGFGVITKIDTDPGYPIEVWFNDSDSVVWYNFEGHSILKGTYPTLHHDIPKPWPAHLTLNDGTVLEFKFKYYPDSGLVVQARRINLEEGHDYYTNIVTFTFAGELRRDEYINNNLGVQLELNNQIKLEEN